MAYTLMQIKKLINVGVISLPNVGKISLINSLKICYDANVEAIHILNQKLRFGAIWT